MKSQISLPASVALALIASSTTLANPIFIRKDGPKCDKINWCSGNNKDDITVKVSDAWTYFGTAKPEDIMKSVKDNCNDSGTCKNSEWEVKTEWEDEDGEGEAVQGSIRVEIVTMTGLETDFEKTRKAMLATLDQVNKGWTEEHEVRETISNGIDLGTTSFRKIRTNWGPSQIVFQRPKQKGSDVDTNFVLQFHQEKAKTGSAELCENIMGIGSAVAGLINPIFGAGAGLATLACGFAEE